MPCPNLDVKFMSFMFFSPRFHIETCIVNVQMNDHRIRSLIEHSCTRWAKRWKETREKWTENDFSLELAYFEFEFVRSGCSKWRTYWIVCLEWWRSLKCDLKVFVNIMLRPSRLMPCHFFFLWSHHRHFACAQRTLCLPLTVAPHNFLALLQSSENLSCRFREECINLFQLAGKCGSERDPTISKNLYSRTRCVSSYFAASQNWNMYCERVSDARSHSIGTRTEFRRRCASVTCWGDRSKFFVVFFFFFVRLIYSCAPSAGTYTATKTQLTHVPILKNSLNHNLLDCGGISVRTT